ncbi:hypothetical protein T484DRAFT_1811275 [Baffinella frigidus]|nr:hypothetical protein T484DRAFT_1811275 [Cryptophyta sp. CCMP2293]
MLLALAEHLLAMLVPESTYAAQKPEVTGSEPEASRFENGVYVGAGAEAVQRGIEATSLVRDRVHRDNVLATDPRLTVWHLANLQRVYRAKIQALETEIAQRRKTGIGNLMPVPGSAALDSPDKKRRSEEADAVVDQAVDASVALQLAAAQDREHQDLLSALAAAQEREHQDLLSADWEHYGLLAVVMRRLMHVSVGEVKAPLPHRKQVTIIAENPAPPSLAALPALGGLAGDSNPANNPLLGNNPPRRINTAPAWNDLMAQGHPRARGKSPAAAAPGGAGGAVNSGPGGNNIERTGPPRDGRA